MTAPALTERSRCGIHGASTTSGRCPECDLDAMSKWVAARRAMRSAVDGSTEWHDALLESTRLELWIGAAAAAGDPVADAFIDRMVDIDEAIRRELHP